MNALLLALRCVLAAVFLVAAIGKFVDLGGSARALRDFGVPERLAALAGPALPVSELAVAAALVFRPSARWGALGALLLLLGFIVGVARAMSQGRTPDCHCFGQLHSEPAGRSTLIRNLVLAAPAALILAAGTGPSLDGGLRSLDGSQLALVATSVLALLLAVAVAQLWVDRRRLRRQLKAVTAGSAPPGLSRGTRAPDFTLTPIRGSRASLDELMERGRPAVLIFLSTNCPPCLEMLPRLARWQESLDDSIGMPAIFAGERVDIERLGDEHALSLVLAQDDNDLFTQYALRATPSAVLVGADRFIAGAPAEGVPAIEALIRSAVNEASPPQLVVHRG